MIELILWDNDGVLVETEDLYLRATRDVLRERGLGLTDEEYHRFFLVESSGLQALVPGATAAELEALRARRNGLYAALLAGETITVDGAAEVLASLHGRIAMGVVTSSLREHFDIIHRRTGFTRYFDFVIAVGDYERPKPDPAPYLAALARTGVPPDRCIVIEDSLRGLIAASGAGLRTWIIPGRLTRGQDLSAADRVLDSIRDIPPLLGR